MSIESALEEFVNEVEKAADAQEEGWASYVPSDYMRERAKNLRAWIEDTRSVLSWLCALKRGDDMQSENEKLSKFAGGGPLMNFYDERRRL